MPQERSYLTSDRRQEDWKTWRPLGKEAREKITPKIRTKSEKSRDKVGKENLNYKPNYVQAQRDIAMRDNTIELLRRELNDVRKDNETLKKELSLEIDTLSEIVGRDLSHWKQI